MGTIATIHATAITTQALSDDHITEYASSVAEFYGVDASNVAATTIYTTTGSMQLSIPEDVDESELEDTIATVIAETLGIHRQDIDVEVDANTGEVSYVINTEDFNEAASTIFDLTKDEYQDAIATSIVEEYPNVEVETISSPVEIVATVEFTVDANNADNDLTQAAWRTEQLLEEFEVAVVDDYITPSPSQTPTAMPSTILFRFPFANGYCINSV